MLVIVGDYLFQADTIEWNPGEYSLQCGRRNDAFKLWAAFKYYGKKGIEERLNRLFELTDYAKNIVNNHERLSLYKEPVMCNLCFTVEGISAQKLCNSLYEKGQALVGFGKMGDDEFVRMAIMNADLTPDDIDDFFKFLLEHG